MDLMSGSLAVVGITSFLYHATLRQTFQFSDDLSMLFLCAALMQRLYCAGRSSTSAIIITVGIYAVVSLMSAIYVQIGDVRIHSSMFALLLTFIWPRTLYLLHWRQWPSQLLGKFVRAVAYLLVGFVLWNIDLQWCTQLRSLRSSMGLPWSWILELHGWWHILTALGAITYMELIRDLCGVEYCNMQVGGR